MSAQGYLFGFPFETTEAKVRHRPSWQPLIVGCGGGQNTGGVLCEMKARGIRPDAIVMADTAGTDPERKGELPETYTWLEKHLGSWLKRNDFPPLTMIYNRSPVAGHRSLYEECMTNGVLPGASYGRKGCTTKWKLQPMWDWVRNWAGAEACYAASSKPLKVIGYDAGHHDQDRASGSGDEDRWHSFWYPLIEWGLDRAGCRASILRAGLALPPGSMCFNCKSRKPHAVLELRKQHPRLFDAGVALEENAERRGGIGGRNAHEYRREHAAQMALIESVKAPVEKEGVVGLGQSWSWKSLAEMHTRDLEKLLALEARREEPGCMVCALDAPQEESS